MWWPAFKAFLRQENPWDGRILFPVWRTVTVGKNHSYQDLLQALQSACMYIGDIPCLCLRKCFFESETRNVDLILISVGELGFVRGAPYRGVFKEINRHGLRLCSAEMLVEARIAYDNQPQNEEMLVVGSNPIDHDSNEVILCLETSTTTQGPGIGYVSYNSFSQQTLKYFAAIRTEITMQTVKKP